jgi:hypothetical protein
MSAIHSRPIFNFYSLALALSYSKDIAYIAINSIFRKKTSLFMQDLTYKRCASVIECSDRLNNLTTAAISIMGISIFVFGYVYYENIRKQNIKIKLSHHELRQLKENSRNLQSKIDLHNAELESLKEQIQKAFELAVKSRFYVADHNKLASANKSKKVAILEIDSDEFEKIQKKYEEIKKASKDHPHIEVQKKIRMYELRVVNLTDELKKEKAKNAFFIQQNKLLIEEIKALTKRLEKPTLEDVDFQAYHEFLIKFCKENNMKPNESQVLQEKIREIIKQFKENKLALEALQAENKFLQEKIDALPKDFPTTKNK